MFSPKFSPHFHLRRDLIYVFTILFPAQRRVVRIEFNRYLSNDYMNLQPDNHISQMTYPGQGAQALEPDAWL